MLNKNVIYKVITLLLVPIITVSFLIPITSYADDGQDEKKGPIVLSLGDSYSSGEGIEPFYGQEKPIYERCNDQDWLAHRSQLAWSGMLKVPGIDGLLTYSKGENYFFYASSGATTGDFYGQQEKTYSREFVNGKVKLPSQLDAFKQFEGDPDYVTLTLGGNDAGFVDILSLAVVTGKFQFPTILKDSLDAVWLDFYMPGGISDHLYKCYLDIDKLSHGNAKIIVAGYPKLVNINGGGLFFNKDEAEMIDKNVHDFNEAIKKLVDKSRENGIKIYFVSVEEEFEGHEAYTEDPWINGIIPGMQAQDLYDHFDIPNSIVSAYSFHPTFDGASAYRNCVQMKIYELEGIDPTTIPNPFPTSVPTPTLSPAETPAEPTEVPAMPTEVPAEPTDPTVPTDTTTTVTPGSGAYIDILYQYQNEIITYEAAYGCYSINYIDITHDDINDLMFLYCPSSNTSYVRLAIYSYDSSTDTAVCLLDRDVTEGGAFEDAALLDNGNLVYYRFYDPIEGDDDDFDEWEGHLYEVELDGAEGVVINHWSCDPGYNSYLNGEFAGPGNVFDEAFDDYKSQVVLPIMPEYRTIEDYSDPSYYSEYGLMTREIYDAGDYYYINDLIALLSGDPGTVVTPTTGTTPAASFSNEIKEAYLDVVNNISYDDFQKSGDYAPTEGEFAFDLIYVNDDDIPELLITHILYNSYCGDMYTSNLYTYADGNVVELMHCCRSEYLNDNTVYYPRENLIVQFYKDNYQTYFYVATRINGSNADETYYEEFYDETIEGMEIHYYLYDHSTYSEIREVTEEAFTADIRGISASTPFVATKSLNEIQGVLQ
ncbi:MAG: hypothetical protein K6E12_07590 [Saccharofermentans sp.]|nr:hypothetical protein [Saccharofermentans sp.]